MNPDLLAASAAVAERRAGDIVAPLERAAEVETADPLHWQRIYEIAARIGDEDLALVAARRLLAVAPKDRRRRIAVLELLAESGSVRDALSMLQKIEREVPADANLAIAAGVYLGRLGREEDALRSLRLAIRRAPESMLAWESLANLRRFSQPDAEVQELGRLARVLGDRPETAGFAFGYAKALDDLGDVDQAFPWFARGCARVLGNRLPRMDDFHRQAAEVRAAFPADAVAACPRSERRERPILVIGCPRSGTTLLERILATSPEAISGGELKLLQLATLPIAPPSPASVAAFVTAAGGDAAAWAQVADTYVRRLVRRFGKADGVIDKGLVNYLYAGALALGLPEARIIHVRRDPMDVAWSCFRRRFHNGLLWSYHFESIAAFIRVYEDTVAHWKQVLPERVLTVDFERLVADPETETSRVFAFAGLERPQDWSSFHERKSVVLTASQLQVRRPLNSDGVGAWRRYERHLGPLRDALARQGLLEGPSST